VPRLPPSRNRLLAWPPDYHLSIVFAFLFWIWPTFLITIHTFLSEPYIIIIILVNVFPQYELANQFLMYCLLQIIMM
jgi:hypothetical protein